MKTRYTVNEAGELNNRTVMVSGVAEGPLLSVGQEGIAQTADGIVRVTVIGTGVIDPNVRMALLEADCTLTPIPDPIPRLM